MTLSSCYLCDQPIEAGQQATGDHVVPIALIGKRQPKVLGFEYGGRIPTHRTCNNHFSDEVFFRHALHLVSIVRSGQLKTPLQSVAHEEISFITITTDQVPLFGERDIRRFDFIDTRNVPYERLNDPEFYRDKKKVNVLRVAMYASLTVLAKSAAALLVRKHLPAVPYKWRIFASVFDADDHSAFDPLFQGVRPFTKTTRAAIKQIGADEWIVLYNHHSLPSFFLFAFHDRETSLFPHLPNADAEVHAFQGSTLNDLLVYQWEAI